MASQSTARRFYYRAFKNPTKTGVLIFGLPFLSKASSWNAPPASGRVVRVEVDVFRRQIGGPEADFTIALLEEEFDAHVAVGAD